MASSWRGISGFLAASILLLAAGCGDSPVSYVRSVNASDGLSNYTIQAGLQGVASSLKYGTEGVQPKGDRDSVDDSSGNYRAIPAGANQKLILYESSPSDVLSSGTQSFPAKTYFTIVTLGSYPFTQVKTLIDGDAAPASGDFKVRFMQAAPGLGPVDVYIAAASASIGGASPVVSNLSFGQATATYSQQAAGKVEIQVTAAGNPSNVFYTGVVNVEAGNLYTAYLLGLPSGTGQGYSLLLVPDPAFVATVPGN